MAVFLCRLFLNLVVPFLMFFIINSKLLHEKIFTLVGLVFITAFASAQIVISEFYGGEDNPDASSKYNYIMLKNIGTIWFP